MNHESHESSERLSQAVTEMRSQSIRTEVLTRGEDAVLSQFPKRSKRVGGVVWTLAGLSTAAAIAVLSLVPNESAMAQVRRIAENGDRVLHHLVSYEVQPDKSEKPSLEVFTDGVKTRYIDMAGNQYLIADSKVTTLYKDGFATVVTQIKKGQSVFEQNSAKSILEKNLHGEVRHVGHEKNVNWNGRKVDKYSVIQSIVDARGNKLESRFELIADPVTERPLEMRSQLQGFPPSVNRWDYPEPDPRLLQLPITSKTKVYDIDEERDEIKTALGKPGTATVVGGQQVELLQVWVDEVGNACAIAQANYSCPVNYGVHINGTTSADFPEGEPFSGMYHVQPANLYEGRPVQFFFGEYARNPVRQKFGNAATVEIPVFSGKNLAGYAKFENVPIKRTWNVHMLLEPENIPFWETRSNGAGSLTKPN